MTTDSDSEAPIRQRSVFPTGWARTLPLRVMREVVQIGGLTPLIHKEVNLDVQGLDQLRTFTGPALIVANHSSHLDTAVLLCSMPHARRRKTAVAAAADYFFDSWWRAGGSAIAFNTFPIERRGGSSSTTPAALFADGWSVIVYPEGTRSRDGFVGRFQMGAAWLAVKHQVPVIPVGLRGTYAAMPRGRRWPVPGRPRVSVRYGAPIYPGPGETPRQLAPKLSAAVKQLIAEDATSWWTTQRDLGPSDLAQRDLAQPKPGTTLAAPLGSWRRIWEQAEAPVSGGRSRHPRIWRH